MFRASLPAAVSEVRMDANIAIKQTSPMMELTNTLSILPLGKLNITIVAFYYLLRRVASMGDDVADGLEK